MPPALMCKAPESPAEIDAVGATEEFERMRSPLLVTLNRVAPEAEAVNIS
jgi:hypothetical protein